MTNDPRPIVRWLFLDGNGRPESRDKRMTYGEAKRYAQERLLNAYPETTQGPSEYAIQPEYSYSRECTPERCFCGYGEGTQQNLWTSLRGTDLYVVIEEWDRWSVVFKIEETEHDIAHAWCGGFDVRPLLTGSEREQILLEAEEARAGA